MFLRLLLAVTLLITPVTATLATSTTEPVFSNGFYFYPGSSQAYNKVAYTDYYWVAATYSNCCYIPGYWQAYTAYKYVPVKLDITAPDIEQKIVELAKARDAAVLKIAAANQKSQAALALVDKLGLTGNFTLPGYGYGIFPVANYAVAAVGTQGTTQYGFQQLSLDIKGLDLNQVMQNYALAVREAQAAGSQANSGLRDTVQQQSKQLADTIQTLAKGQSASQLATAAGKAVDPPPSASLTKIASVATAIQGTSGSLTPPAQGQAVEFAKLPGPSTCVACHSGAKKEGGIRFKGGFDINAYPTLSEADQEYVMSLITTSDATKKMPKNHPALTRLQRADFDAFTTK